MSFEVAEAPYKYQLQNQFIKKIGSGKKPFITPSSQT